MYFLTLFAVFNGVMMILLLSTATICEGERMGKIDITGENLPLVASSKVTAGIVSTQNDYHDTSWPECQQLSRMTKGEITTHLRSCETVTSP